MNIPTTVSEQLNSFDVRSSDSWSLDMQDIWIVFNVHHTPILVPTGHLKRM